MTRALKKLSVEKARDALARCKSIDEAKELRDQAQAAELYLRMQRAGRDIQNDAAEIIVLAERRMGELLSTMQKNRGGRPSKTGRSDRPVLTLKNLGISKDGAVRAQKLAELPAELVKQRLAEAREQLGRVTVAAVLNEAKPRKKASPSLQTRRTPQWLFDELDDRFGPFELDAFADESNALCAKYYTRETDGLTSPWLNVTFGNPEFKTMMAAALEQAVRQAELGIRSVILGPTGCSQEWFHQWAILGTVYVPNRRINFDEPDGTPTDGADRDSMVFAFGGPEDNPFWRRAEFRVLALNLEGPPKED